MNGFFFLHERDNVIVVIFLKAKQTMGLAWRGKCWYREFRDSDVAASNAAFFFLSCHNLETLNFLMFLLSSFLSAYP